MKLFSLYYGRKKAKINDLLMTDSLKKCQNFQKSREHNVSGFHEIRPAVADAKVKKKSSTIGGNKATRVPHINRKGQTVRNGYISKNGFVEHT